MYPKLLLLPVFRLMNVHGFMQEAAEAFFHLSSMLCLKAVYIYLD